MYRTCGQKTVESESVIKYNSWLYIDNNVLDVRSSVRLDSMLLEIYFF